MNQISEIRNPFTAPGALTFADLIAAIEINQTLGWSKRRDLCSALRSVASWLNRAPAEVPASAEFVRRGLDQFHPDHSQITRKRIQNASALIKQAFRLSGIIESRATYLSPLLPGWRALYDRLPENGDRYGLSRFMRYCSAQEIPPVGVTSVTFDTFHRALTEEALTKNPRDQHQTACRVWNRCVRSLPDWPQVIVSVPSYAETYSTPLSGYPLSFQTDVETYLDRLALVDPLDDDGPPRALRPRSITTRRAQIRLLAAGLVHKDHPVDQIDSLAYLVKHYRDALRFHIERRGDQAPSSTIAQLADCVRTIAKYQVKSDPKILAEIERIKRKLTPQHIGLTPKNRERLGQFDQDINIKRLLWYARQEFDRIKKLGTHTLHNAVAIQLAVAVEILLHIPMRVTNLAQLHLQNNLRWQGSGRTSRLAIHVPAEQVKNSQPVDVILPIDVSNMIKSYIEVYRPRLVNGSCDWLFPGATGGPKRADTLSKQFCGALWEHCGLRINPHLMRHIAAKLLVQTLPGNYEGARRLLGHKNSNTTYQFYEGEETKSVTELWGGILRKTRGHTSDVRCDGLKDTRPMRRLARKS
jgi:integrase